MAALAACAWAGLGSGAAGDWTTEARPSVDALLAGHVARFLAVAPAYGGSLLIRAPFMALSRLWGGGDIAVYRLSALPCLAALGALLWWLDAEYRRRGHGTAARVAAALAGGFCPLAITALEAGHPEEMLGAVLCVTAVLCAQRDHAVWGGILVGLAIANKEWGVLAAGPCLVALTHGRVRFLASMTTVAALLFAPFVLVHAGGFVGQTEAVAVHSGGLFSPFQLWWSLGSPIGGGARMGPGWLGALGHTLPIGIAVPLTVAFARRARRAPARRRRDAILLLALLLLLRCALDPWDAGYYAVPFLTAVLVWEATSFDRPPLLGVIASLAGWLVCSAAAVQLGADQDTLAMAFAVIAVPAIGAIGWRLLSARPTQADPTGRGRSTTAETHAVRPRPATS